MEDRQTVYELMQEDAAGAINDLIIGIMYEFARLATLGVYHDPEAEKVRYEEAFQMGVEIVDAVNLYMQFSYMFSGAMGGTGYTSYYGGVGGQATNPIVAQTTLPATNSWMPVGMPVVPVSGLLPTNITNQGNYENVFPEIQMIYYPKYLEIKK